ncbi:MAG: undecaprenyl/decaprenyl-phosphate alpha-N-acetylglucosaminyl 1-phosphate transferase [Planctomycetales bacterium]|nr:undecaprenyl/decaprenyl-phosphate alpha-N-acetylglucosaminyl 1-phosphate transferase [Planctomycetales bacterium]
MNFLAAPVALAAACFASLALTPLIIQLATRWGVVDCPDGRRKHQKAPIPLGGGVAVALAAALAAVATIVGFSDASLGGSRLASGLVPAAAVLIIVGLIDDVLTLTGIYKLLGQVLAVSILVYSGFQFESVSVLGWSVPFGRYAAPFSIFFCLGAINAFNLLDGADGLASSIGAIVSLTLAIITWSMHDYIDSVACLAFAGALLGFLNFNRVPARIYLGDTGSMLIGLFVAAVAINCSIKEQAAFALAVPIAVCAIPILDAAAALVRRVTTRQSVFTPDRGHLHHALLLRGWSVGKTVGFIAGLTAMTCLGAIVSFFANNELFAILATLGVFGALSALRIFGHSELRLIASHTRALGRRVLRGTPFKRVAGRGKMLDLENAVHLQGNREWHNVWFALREAAPGYHLVGLRLNVNIPHLHESFYASWTKEEQSGDEPWRLQLPLRSEDRVVGKLVIMGDAARPQTLQEMQSLLEFLEPLEAEIERLIAHVPAAAPVTPAPKVRPVAPALAARR